MKWLVGALAVLFAFWAGFGLGWKVHGSEPIASAAPKAAPTLSLADSAIALPVAPLPVVDAGAFEWPAAKASPRGITRVDETHYIVDRSVANGLADASTLGSIRIVPESRDGGVVGMRLFAVRPGTTAAKLGFENGDRVESVDGLPLTGPDDALAAYRELRRASVAHVRIVRGGKPMVLEYELTR